MAYSLDKATKIIIINDIEQNVKDYNTDGYITMQLQLTNEESHILDNVLPSISAKDVNKIIADHDIDYFTISIFMNPSSDYYLQISIYDMGNNEEYRSDIELNYDGILNILMKAIYYDLRISDDGFDNGMDFIIKAPAPIPSTDMEILYFYRRVGIWDTLNHANAQILRSYTNIIKSKHQNL